MPRPKLDVGAGFLTVNEAAAFLRVSRVTVYALMRRKELPSALFAGRRRLPRAGLEGYARRQLARGG